MYAEREPVCISRLLLSRLLLWYRHAGPRPVKTNSLLRICVIFQDFGHLPSAAFVQPAISIPLPLTRASAIWRRASCRSRHAVLREILSFSAASSCSSPSRSMSHQLNLIGL